MDPWDHIRRAAADRRSGSVEVTRRAAIGVAGLRTRRDVVRAARALLRAHPAMAPLWRLLATAYEDPDAAAGYVETLEAETAAAVDAVRWVVTRRATVVLTHSASGTVERALDRVRGRVSSVLCTASLPGGEGRGLATRLARAGFEAEVVPDAAVAQACRRAHVALVGADAITEAGLVNKIGTRVLAVCALDARIGSYAIAAGSKLLPESARVDEDDYESTPLELFDAIVTERGPQRPGQIRRAAAKVKIPDAIGRVVG